MLEPPPICPVEALHWRSSHLPCPTAQAKVMLIKPAPQPAANPGRKRSLYFSGGPGSLRGKTQPPWQQGRRTLRTGCTHSTHTHTFSHSARQLCSWPLRGAFPSGILPPRSPSLAITSFTAQLQVHSHQEVFPLSHFFCIHSAWLYLVPAA